MVKNNIKINLNLLYKTAYAYSNSMTPMLFDCGELCATKCCTGNKGMLLFPFEEDYISQFDNEYIITKSNIVINNRAVRLLNCNGNCCRGLRPLSCRFFPLFPFLDESGKLELKFDPRAQGICPLQLTDLEGIYIRGIFRLKALKLANILCSEEHIRKFIQRMTLELKEYERFLL